MTILISSHILEELSHTASQFIFIEKGKIMEELSDSELKERCRQHIAIKSADPQNTLLILEDKLQTDNLQLMPDGTIRLYDHLENMEQVARILLESHILVTELHLSGDTLEDYFLRRVGGSSHD